MINVTTENFDAEVIQASLSTFVLVDFWAEWCGPCKALGPLLEKLETDYAGRFTLVKIDSDAQQELSQAFGIRSLPTCILMKDGKPLDGFMGALPEGKVREFLDKHLPSEDALLAEADAQEAQAALAAGDTASAQERLAEALAAQPGNDDIRFDYVKLLMGTGQLNEAEVTLAPGLAQIPVPLRFAALRQWLNAMRFVTTDPRGQWEIDQFDALIEANKRDFDTRFAKSRVLMAQGDYTAAMDELLEIIMRDKKWLDEAPRKTFVAILELLTPPKPKTIADTTGKTASGIEIAGKSAVQEDPQAAMVSSYRRKLSMMLN
jgi:putative thioredoxin